MLQSIGWASDLSPNGLPASIHFLDDSFCHPLKTNLNQYNRDTDLMEEVASS